MSRTLFVTATAALAVLAPSTAMAADGARGEANALRVTVGGQDPQGTGTVVATNDGTGEEKSGPVDPAVSVLSGQPFVDLGVLAQDAAANDDGTSEACAGVAGDGGSVIEIGDSGCLEPGENIALGLSDLDLSWLLETEAVQGTGDLGDLLGTLGAEDLALVVGALNDALDQVTAQIGDAGLYVDADAIQAFCTADGESAEGTTLLANAGLRVAIPGGGSTRIVDFDPEPEPNTRPVTQMNKITALIISELETAFNDELDDLTQPLIDALLTPVVQDQIVDEAVAQLQPALTEIEKNLLEIILNKQDKSQGGKRIDVTGLYVRLLPAAEAAGAPAPLAQVEVANVGCGPMAANAGGGTPTDEEGNPVPTTVNAGADAATGGGTGGVGLAALLASVVALLGVGVLARLTARE